MIAIKDRKMFDFWNNNLIGKNKGDWHNRKNTIVLCFRTKDNEVWNKENKNNYNQAFLTREANDRWWNDWLAQ